MLKSIGGVDVAKQENGTGYLSVAQHEVDLERLFSSYSEGRAEDAARLEEEIAGCVAATRESVFLPFAFLCGAFELSRVERFALLCAWRGGISLEEALPMLGLDAEDAEAAISSVVLDRFLLALLLEWGQDELPSRPLALRGRVRMFLRDPFSDPFFSAQMLWPGEAQELLFAQDAHLRLVRAAQAHRPDEGATALWICGGEGSGKRTQAGCLAHAMRVPLLAVDARVDASVLDVALECMLRGALPCILHAETLGREEEASARELLARFSIVVFCSETEAPPWLRTYGSVYQTKLRKPDFSERLALWEQMTSGLSMWDIDLPALSGKFSLTPGQIARAVGDAAAEMRMSGKTAVDSAMLHAACRMQLTGKLNDRVRRVEGTFSWDDLVLPPLPGLLLRTAMDQVRFRHTVYGAWGMDKALPYGRGLSMLFSGPPGTGKTMAAQVVARELMLDMYQVDLSGVVSKYVGETERNLREVFDEMEGAQGILFFDEADALFGKRTELKDAQDRYANMEASYLLQRIETYAGIVILATNNYQNFDEAFRRRIKFVIDFPFPDAAQRQRIWGGALPSSVPVEGIDFRFLSRFELSGSSIKNVAVNAAFLAASEEMPVGMTHMLKALRMEMHKSGKALLREDLGEYYGRLDGDEM